MAHGNTDSTKATAQNAVTDEEQPNDPGRAQKAADHPEARAYTAPDFRDASLSAPAAGEVGDFADLDEPSGGMAQGRTNTNREAHAQDQGQGPKTQAANRAMSGSGSSDQGSQ